MHIFSFSYQILITIIPSKFFVDLTFVFLYQFYNIIFDLHKSITYYRQYIIYCAYI